MSSFISNPHKKGEHVFNDICGSLENCINAALKTERAGTLILSNRFGPLSVTELPKTSLTLGRLQKDPIFVQARTVTAPATGVANDANSVAYGAAVDRLREILSDAVVAGADLIWKQKPQRNSSFLEFEKVVDTVKSWTSLKVEARSAVDGLLAAGIDPKAEASALAEKAGPAEINRRKAAIVAMKQHLPALRQEAYGLLQTFFDELEQVLERRIGAA